MLFKICAVADSDTYFCIGVSFGRFKYLYHNIKHIIITKSKNKNKIDIRYSTVQGDKLINNVLFWYYPKRFYVNAT